MPVRVVIDTNNMGVSALLNPSGYPAMLRKAFEDQLFEVVISEPILKEIAEVLSRPSIKNKYGITETDIKELLILIEERSEHILVSGKFSVCRDKDDDLIIETAVKGNAKYLVTRDDDIKTDTKVSAFLSQSGISTISIAKFFKIITLKS